MPTFVGFNTQEQYKKFTLLDSDLVKQDFVNALNIRQGQLPGRVGGRGRAVLRALASEF